MLKAAHFPFSKSNIRWSSCSHSANAVLSHTWTLGLYRQSKGMGHSFYCPIPVPWHPSWAWPVLSSASNFGMGHSFYRPIPDIYHVSHLKHFFINRLLGEWLPQLQSGMWLDNGLTSLDFKMRPQKSSDFFNVKKYKSVLFRYLIII